MKTLALIPVVMLAVAGTAYAAPMLKTVKTDKGEVLAGDKGMTLYTFQNDKKDVSNCYDKCATNWPPLMAKADDKAGDGYTVIDRKDGTKQWAKDGKPLYYWVKDMKEGDATGDGVGGVWHVAKP